VLFWRSFDTRLRCGSFNIFSALLAPNTAPFSALWHAVPEQTELRDLFCLRDEDGAL
jgi:hypothetical protein